jgi:hypothetical protein
MKVNYLLAIAQYPIAPLHLLVCTRQGLVQSFATNSLTESSATEISRPSSITEEAADVLRPTMPQLPPAHDEKYDSAVEAEPAPKARGLKRSRSMWSVFGRN